MSANVLPDMEEPRLKALGKQLVRSRKASIIYSTKVKEKFSVYEKSLNKEQRSLSYKHSLSSLRLKKNLAQVRGTQKCLKRKREQTFLNDTKDYPFGVYEGESLATYRRQVDDIIQDRHPRVRRLKKVEHYMQTGKSCGRIIDEEDARMQFDILMRRGPLIRREHPLGLTFIEDNRNSYLERSESSISSSRGETLTPKSSPTRLNLPPIAASKEFVRNKRGTHAIRRATKCAANSSVDLPLIGRLGSRRATTFL